MCGNNSACDTGRECDNATGVTYGDPDALFECTCLNDSHCPTTTDFCNTTSTPSMCTCGNDAPCDAPSQCLNLTLYPGQPKCSCQSTSDCLENADNCDNSTSPTSCQCSSNTNSSVCDEQRVCLNLTAYVGQPPCSCLESMDCSENSDTCNTTSSPPMCECSSNVPTYSPCDAGRLCINMTEAPLQPGCSCLEASHCLSNADSCNTTTTPSTCGCSRNGPTASPCSLGRICLNETELPKQPACSCLNSSHCLDNADSCNTTMSSGNCECSGNAPSFEACDVGRVCLNITSDVGQPPCSCLLDNHCLNNADTCNTTYSPSLCECSFNAPNFTVCDQGRICLNTTEAPGQPACSCLASGDCLDNADSCNRTTVPPTCECSFNTPTKAACAAGRQCLNTTEEVGQPPCSCLNSSHCFVNADTCNTTTQRCECSANPPFYDPCGPGRYCISGFGCSCESDAQCEDLGVTDTCNVTLTPASCECSFNTPSFEPCDVDRICLNVTENPGQPPCSCMNVSHCFENADTCNTSISPSSCGCKDNAPGFGPCDSDRICVNLTDLPGQPACSCLNASHCLENSDTCNSTTIPPSCECSSNPPMNSPCDDGRVCINTTESPLQPGCSCLEAFHCLSNADICNTTASPAICECSGNGLTSLPCTIDRVCLNITITPKQPACSCLDDSHCLDNSDTCNTTSNPATCQCMGNTPSFEACDAGRVCLNMTKYSGQPSCSCLADDQCLDNANNCNSTSVPAMCGCSFNGPTFSTCDDNRFCLNVTELPGQPGCSCLETSHCLDNADSCNTTITPSSCECSANAPNSSVCDPGRTCLDIPSNPGQPPCSCTEAAHCFENADTCNKTLSPPMCGCEANSPSFGPCDTGRVCLNKTELPFQPACSCLTDTHCLDNTDNCNTTSARCQCGSNDACHIDSLCIKNYTITGGEGPQCTCQNLPGFGCPATANQCDNSTDPPSCKCNGNPPCGIDQICMDMEGQPECSCLTNEQCEITGDTCDVTSNPPLCKCGNGTACSAAEECVGGVCYVSIPQIHYKLP